MKLHDFIPGRAYRTLCLHGFAPKDSTQWEAAYGLLLRCHERLGIHPEWVVLDDVPGLSEETRSLEVFEEWLKKHPFPLPSMLSVGTSLIRGMTLPWRIDTRVRRYRVSAVFPERKLMPTKTRAFRHAADTVSRLGKVW